MARIALTIIGVLFCLTGVVWFLQGIGVLPGSFMTGQSQWAIYGVLIFLVGIGLGVFANRRRTTLPGG